MYLPVEDYESLIRLNSSLISVVTFLCIILGAFFVSFLVFCFKRKKMKGSN